MVYGAGDRAVGARRTGKGTRARCRRRRLRHQTLRNGGIARQIARGRTQNSSKRQHGRVTTEAFTVDLAARRVMAGQDEIRLTPTEWHLLETLVRYAGKPSLSVNSCSRYGGPAMAQRPTTFACISPTCAASWNGSQSPPLPDHRAGHRIPVHAGSDDRSQRNIASGSISLSDLVSLCCARSATAAAGVPPGQADPKASAASSTSLSAAASGPRAGAGVPPRKGR